MAISETSVWTSYQTRTVAILDVMATENHEAVQRVIQNLYKPLWTKFCSAISFCFFTASIPVTPKKWTKSCTVSLKFHTILIEGCFIIMRCWFFKKYFQARTSTILSVFAESECISLLNVLLDTDC